MISIIWLFLACGLSAKKIESKPDPWLRKKIETTQDQEAIIAILKEMSIRRSSSFLPAIIEYSNHPLDSVRKAALEALIAYGPSLDDDRRDQAYLDRLSDKNVAVSNLAKKGIEQRIQSELKTTFLINSLLDQLQKSRNWKEQLRILEIVQWIDNEKNIAILSDFARNHSNPQVRLLAIQSLGQLKVESARNLLYEIQHSDLNEDVRKSAEQALTQIGGKINNLVIAVMPFENQGLAKAQATGLQNYLSGSLSSAKVATVVERGQVNKIMDELVYQDSFINDDQAIAIGRSLRASQVITGSIQVSGNNMTITIKRIDIESQEILSSAQASGLVIDFDALQRQVSQDFIARF